MITASIVTYNTNKSELERIIKCASLSVDMIYVIDNSPINELEEFTKNISSKIEYVFNNKNYGYGGAHNIALKKAMKLNSDYHIILNPDIYFHSEVIIELQKYMEQHKDVGSIMPQVKYPNGEIQYLCKLQATPFDMIGRRFFPKKFTLKRNNKYELRHSGYNRIMNVPCLSGCFMFIRVSILDEIGLFDNNYFMYCEDFDFYKRIHKKYKTIFYPNVSVIHAHKKESYINKKLLKMHILSAIKYFNKWGWFIDNDRRSANKEILTDIKNNENN